MLTESDRSYRTTEYGILSLQSCTTPNRLLWHENQSFIEGLTHRIKWIHTRQANCTIVLLLLIHFCPVPDVTWPQNENREFRAESHPNFIATTHIPNS